MLVIQLELFILNKCKENAHDLCNAMKCHKNECPGLPWFAELYKISWSSTPRFSPSENNQKQQSKISSNTV
jgi:hypothetical protein